MISRLSPQESTAARQWLKAAAGEDVSSNGSFASRAEGDSVVIRDRTGGTETVVPTPGYKPVETTVSDDGKTVAFLARSPSDAGKSTLVRVRDGQCEVLEKEAIALHSPDLSADGMRVYCSSCYDVVAYDGNGGKNLVKLPSFIDRVEVMPQGRVLAQASTNGWGGRSAPVYFLLDEQGQSEMISSVPEAESLGVPVRDPLKTQYEAAYPGATPQQRESLLEKFGYQMPTYRLFSPDKKHQVFEFSPRISAGSGSSDEVAGTYLLECGRGDAVLITGPNDGKGIGTRSLGSIEWSAKSRRMALVFARTNHDAKLIVADADGTSIRVVPAKLPAEAEKRVLKWSDDEQRLAFEARENDRTHLWCYDTASGMFFPVAADVRLEGWKDDLLRVRLPDDRVVEIPALPMDPEQGFGVITGNPTPGGPKPPPVPTKVTDEYVEVGGVKVPRRQEGSAQPRTTGPSGREGAR